MQKPFRIALLGECMIELRGEMFGTMQESFGGDTLNTAVYLSRLAADSGIQVLYATQLGTDPYSAAMTTAWKSESIDVSLLSSEGGRMPGLYTIQVDEHGERAFYYWRDASAAKGYFEGASSPLEDAIDRLDGLYYSGISLAVLPEHGRERLFAFIERFRARGGKVYFDNNYRPRLWSATPNVQAWYDRAWAHADMAMITLDDNQAIYDIPDEQVALDHALSLPPTEVVVKRGSKPTLVRIKGQSLLEIPTFKVDKVVDTTGAGDSFAGGYLAARLQGVGPDISARSGNKIASIVIQHPGAIIPKNAMPVFFFG